MPLLEVSHGCVNVTSLAASFPERADASWILSSIRMTELVAAICDNFEFSSMHAFTQTHISGLLVFGTCTSVPELPSLWKSFVSVIGPILIPARNFFLKKVCTFNTSTSVSFSATYAELSGAVS